MPNLAATLKEEIQRLARREIKAQTGSTKQAVAHRNVHDGIGPLDGITFLNVPVGPEDHDADIVDLEVQRQMGRWSPTTDESYIRSIRGSVEKAQAAIAQKIRDSEIGRAHV